jgi:hypothetical protein
MGVTRFCVEVIVCPIGPIATGLIGGAPSA